MRKRIQLLLADERGSGTTSSAIRIGLFVVAGLALVGIAYEKVIAPLMTQAGTCASAAAGSTSGASTGAGASIGSTGC